VWHEAAGTALFKPLHASKETDLIWIGNWGDDERTAELFTYLIGPVERLGLHARVHGVRYPEDAKAALAARGILYRGWLPNHKVPQAFAAARATVHVPRGPYVTALPGIPTIRMFEALACGIPIVSAPWSDVEGLFPADSYLRVTSEDQMCAALRRVLADEAFASELARKGLRAIHERHTCAHRVAELVDIVEELQGPRARRVRAMQTGQQVLAS
jgi:spore maturation protein CgeB